MRDFCETHGFQHVPILNDGTYELSDSVDEIVEMSKGNSTLYNVLREGIVVRSASEPRFSFKVINPEFLLKYD